MRKTILLPSLSRVVAGSTATLELPTGPTYERVIFTATGTALAAAHIGRITVFIDGRSVMTFKNYQRLADLNSYYNRAADAVTQFALHFFRAELHDLVYRRAPGIGTADVQTVHIEIELAAGAPGDITLKAHAEINPAPQPLGAFVKVREYPYSTAVSGQVEIDKLPRGPWYQAFHLFKADISAVELTVDQTKMVEATKAVLERAQKEASPVKRVPVTGSATHVDLVTQGDLAQALNTNKVQDLRLKATFDTSGAADIVTETLDTLTGA